MGSIFHRNKKVQQKQPPTKAVVQNVDVVKLKLKQSRDTIQNFIKKKEIDIEQVNIKLREKIPIYQAKNDRSVLLPLLQTKKQLTIMVEKFQLRLKIVNDQLLSVQMKQMDADIVSVLDETNKYIDEIQNQLDQKDWESILEEAQQNKNKCQINWPEEEDMSDDPIFKELWKQIGGAKTEKSKVQIPAQKQVKLQINQDEQKQNSNAVLNIA